MGAIIRLVVIGRQESGGRRAPGIWARSSGPPPGARQAVSWSGGGHVPPWRGWAWHVVTGVPDRVNNGSLTSFL